MRTSIRSAAVVVACMMFGVVVGASWQAHAAGRTLDFTVLRDGKNIGTHRYTISKHGDETLVEVSTDIKVKVLFVTAYKFIHASKEVWKNGQLVMLNSTTDDDGTRKELHITAKDGKLMADSVVKGQDRRQSANADILPASLWKQDIVKQNAVLNTLDGTVMNIKVKDLGDDQVEAGGARVNAHHYSITGELTRELWFSGAGDLVRVRFPDKTGTEIVYALK